MLNKHDLKKTVIAYVKDEGSNFNTMIIILQFLVSCDVLGLAKSFQGNCFGHAFSKACQYASTNEKVYKGFKYVSIKITQSNLHKCITWPKNQ
jgi:hypothetical protein